jgi:prepilin-type processing-associated H-X9-DG protein
MKPHRRDPSSRAGHVIVRILGLLLVIAAVVGALFYVLGQVRRTATCADQLKSIYRALELYEMERGVLPSLAFYPDHALEDLDSLRVVLEPYGVSGARCICPSARPVQRAEGLTYLWNVSLNGQRMPRESEAVWMLVDMNALSDDVPSPHLGRYNALFSDGSVRRIRDPRRELPGL